MNNPEICFRFDKSVLLHDVEGTLELARMAAASLHGEDRVLIEASHAFDPVSRAVSIDTGTEVGRTLACVFHGYVVREFGPAAVRAERGNHALLAGVSR